MIRKNERESWKLKTSPLRIIFFCNPNFMLLQTQIKLFISFTHAVLDLKFVMSRIYKSTVHRIAYNLLLSILICQKFQTCCIRRRFLRNRILPAWEQHKNIAVCSFRLFQIEPLFCGKNKFRDRLVSTPTCYSAGSVFKSEFGNLPSWLKCFVVSSVHPDILE
jgi:hypothetical protein